MVIMVGVITFFGLGMREMSLFFFCVCVFTSDLSVVRILCIRIMERWFCICFSFFFLSNVPSLLVCVYANSHNTYLTVDTI